MLCVLHLHRKLQLRDKLWRSQGRGILTQQGLKEEEEEETSIEKLRNYINIITSIFRNTKEGLLLKTTSALSSSFLLVVLVAAFVAVVVAGGGGGANLSRNDRPSRSAHK